MQAHANVAAACFKELSDHIFIGGSLNVLNSDSGMHLASKFLPQFPEDLSKINEKALIVQPDTSVRACWMRGSRFPC
jgi:hypothetical protein